MRHVAALSRQVVTGRKTDSELLSVKNTMKEIEIIDQHNARHRFSAETHFYEWRLKPGTIDIEGNEFLDVFIKTDDEHELVATFPRPAMVGMVTDSTMLAVPLREMTGERCPRCGYTRHMKR